MAAFVMVLWFDGGEGARARPIVPRRVPEHVSHGIEYLRIVYTNNIQLSTNPSRPEYIQTYGVVAQSLRQSLQICITNWVSTVGILGWGDGVHVWPEKRVHSTVAIATRIRVRGSKVR